MELVSKVGMQAAEKETMQNLELVKEIQRH